MLAFCLSNKLHLVILSWRNICAVKRLDYFGPCPECPSFSVSSSAASHISPLHSLWNLSLILRHRGVIHVILGFTLAGGISTPHTPTYSQVALWGLYSNRHSTNTVRHWSRIWWNISSYRACYRGELSSTDCVWQNVINEFWIGSALRHRRGGAL